jgi:hypothetical protein
MKLYTFEPDLIDNPDWDYNVGEGAPYLVQVRLAGVLIYTHPIQWNGGFSGWREECLDQAMEVIANKLKDLING